MVFFIIMLGKYLFYNVVVVVLGLVKGRGFVFEIVKFVLVILGFFI